MRILLAHDRCGYQGGVEQYLADLSALRRRGHELHLAHGPDTTRDPQGFRTLFDSASPVAELGSTEGPPLLDVVRQVQPDVFFMHKAQQPGTLLEILQGAGCYASTVRSVCMVHDHDVYCPRRHKYYLWTGEVCTRPAGWHCLVDGAFVERSATTPWGVRWVSLRERLQEMRRVQAYDRVLVASTFVRDQLQGNGFPPQRVHVLPLAIPHRATPDVPEPLVPAVFAPPLGLLAQTGEEVKPRGEEPLALVGGKPDPLKLLFVGQLVRGKGLDLLLRALAGLRGNWSLDVVGAGNALDDLLGLAERLQLGNRVRWRGWLREAALAKTYESSSALVVPSRWPEPYGMVGLEAMRAGCCVVAFAVGGIKDWLRHEETGLAVAPGEVKALSAALQRLLDEPTLAERLGSSARRWVAEHHDFEAYLTRLEVHLRGDS